MVSLEQIKQLREETGVSISECKKALEQSQGDFNKAKELLKQWGKEFAAKKTSRTSEQGIIESYVHANKKIGVLLDLRCETDFVAKNPDFKELAHELCLQIAAVNPDEFPLFEQPWIKDDTKTVKDLINSFISKVGENIVVKNFIRFEI